MEGIETLKKSKELEHNKNKDVAVIALTANTISGAKEMYMREGFTDYLSKPIVGKILEDKLAKYIPADKMNVVQEVEAESIEKAVEAEVQKSVGLTSNLKNAENSANLLDPNMGMKYCGGSKEMYLEVLKMFYQQHAEKKAHLEVFYGGKNWNDYTVSIHSLKTNALNVGCESFAEKCLQLEKAGKKLRENIETEDSLSFITDNHAQTMAFYDKVINEVKAYLNQEGVEL